MVTLEEPESHHSSSTYSLDRFDFCWTRVVCWLEENKFIFLVLLWILVFAGLAVQMFQQFRSFRHYMPEPHKRNKHQPDDPLPTKGPIELRVLSWNIFMRPPLISSYRGDYKNERLAYFINDYLSKYDIIALQEMFCFGSGRRHRLIKAAKRAGFLYHASAPHGFIDGGLVILSRFPIMHSAFRPFPRGIHSDMLADKGVLYANIHLSNNLEIDLFTTHLQASYRHPSSERELKIRKAQLDIIHGFINEHSSHDTSGNRVTVLCGDLNINATSPEDDCRYLHSLFESNFVPLNTMPTYGVASHCYRSCCGLPDFVQETCFTHKHSWESCQAIDHFWIRGAMNGYEAECTVNQMLAAKEESRFTHLSGKNETLLANLNRPFCNPGNFQVAPRRE